MLGWWLLVAVAVLVPVEMTVVVVGISEGSTTFATTKTTTNTTSATASTSVTTTKWHELVEVEEWLHYDEETWRKFGKKKINVILRHTPGGPVETWLACSTPEQVLRVRALAEDIVLCPWARHFTLTVPLSTQVYKWVPAKLMLRVTLRWTGIPSRREYRNRDKLQPDGPLGQNVWPLRQIYNFSRAFL